MANTRSGNTWYVDTAHASAADDLLSKGIRVVGAVVTSTGASGRMVLSDAVSNQTKLDLRVAAINGNTGGDTRVFSFSDTPITFSNGIVVTTLTTCVATLITQEGSGG